MSVVTTEITYRYPGHLPELFQHQAAEVCCTIPFIYRVYSDGPGVYQADFKWQAMYGDVVRIKGPLGVCQIILLVQLTYPNKNWRLTQEDRLWISDPKALQYIYQTSGYNFPKAPERRELSRLLMGRGLVWADGKLGLSCISCRWLNYDYRWRS